MRKGRHMAADLGSIRPLHVVLAGLGLGLVFVLTLILIVRLIVAGAS